MQNKLCILSIPQKMRRCRAHTKRINAHIRSLAWSSTKRSHMHTKNGKHVNTSWKWIKHSMVPCWEPHAQQSYKCVNGALPAFPVLDMFRTLALKQLSHVLLQSLKCFKQVYLAHLNAFFCDFCVFCKRIYVIYVCVYAHCLRALLPFAGTHLNHHQQLFAALKFFMVT